jgi:hypothetical protein
MTVYANLVDGELRGRYDLLPKTWNDHEHFHLKCAVDENFMRANGFVKIIRDTRSYDPATHKMSDSMTYTVVDGEVYEHREIIPRPPEVIEPVEVIESSAEEQPPQE